MNFDLLLLIMFNFDCPPNLTTHAHTKGTWPKPKRMKIGRKNVWKPIKLKIWSHCNRYGLCTSHIYIYILETKKYELFFFFFLNEYFGMHSYVYSLGNPHESEYVNLCALHWIRIANSLIDYIRSGCNGPSLGSNWTKLLSHGLKVYKFQNN